MKTWGQEMAKRQRRAITKKFIELLLLAFFFGCLAWLLGGNQ